LKKRLILTFFWVQFIANNALLFSSLDSVLFYSAAPFFSFVRLAPQGSVILNARISPKGDFAAWLQGLIDITILVCFDGAHVVSFFQMVIRCSWQTFPTRPTRWLLSRLCLGRSRIFKYLRTALKFCL
jgi:hypothetical protein